MDSGETTSISTELSSSVSDVEEYHLSGEEKETEQTHDNNVNRHTTTTIITSDHRRNFPTPTTSPTSTTSSRLFTTKKNKTKYSLVWFIVPIIGIVAVMIGLYFTCLVCLMRIENMFVFGFSSCGVLLLLREKSTEATVGEYSTINTATTIRFKNRI